VRITLLLAVAGRARAPCADCDARALWQEKSKTLLALGQRQLKQLHATGSLIGGDSAKWRGRRTAK